MAHLAGHHSLTSLKRCSTGIDGAKWCGALADHLHGPRIVSDVSTTMIYTHVFDEEMEQARRRRETLVRSL